MSCSLNINDFLIRGLYKTLDFFKKTKIEMAPTTISYLPTDTLYTVYLNLKEYYLSYTLLLCTESTKNLDKIHFCECCSNIKNFQRNYSLFLSKKGKIKTDCETSDPFLLYLVGLCNRDTKTLYEVIRINPYLWEAYLSIIDLTTPSNLQEVDGPFKDYFYMTLFVKKQICKEFNLKSDFLNLKGAVLYFRRDYKEAEVIFKKCKYIDYLDLYSNILYINKDPELFNLSHKLIKLNRYRAETFCCIANTYSMKKDSLKAIEYYNVCTKLLPSSMYFTLLGHEYLEIKEYKKAIQVYTEGIKHCNEDYRGWYSLGKVYEVLNMTETALFFYKKAIEYKKDDTLAWLSLGNIYVLLEEFENGLKCFKQSVRLKDPLGYLYIAETYKGMKMYSESAEYYEKYVCECKEKDGDFVKICVFLEEYFRKICDIEKSRKYYEMARKN